MIERSPLYFNRAPRVVSTASEKSSSSSAAAAAAAAHDSATDAMRVDVQNVIALAFHRIAPLQSGEATMCLHVAATSRP